MTLLRSIELKIEGAVERTFGRLFRSALQPVELARKLAKEMESHKTVSVSRVYVPNEYTVYLSPSDRDQFASYENSLRTELAGYLRDYARHERLALLSEPQVLLETDTDLRPGEFGIACRVVDPPAAAAADAARPPEPAAEVPAPPAVPGGTGWEALGKWIKPPPILPVPEPEPQPPPPEPQAPPTIAPYEPLVGVSGTQILSAEEARAEGLVQESLSLVVGGRRHTITKRVTTLGRSRDCDVLLSDANASRVHAEVRHIGLDYFLVDLGSTNGTEVNGQRIKRHALANGDRILVGTTEIVVEHVT